MEVLVSNSFFQIVNLFDNGIDTSSMRASILWGYFINYIHSTLAGLARSNGLPTNPVVVCCLPQPARPLPTPRVPGVLFTHRSPQVEGFPRAGQGPPAEGKLSLWAL